MLVLQAIFLVFSFQPGPYYPFPSFSFISDSHLSQASMTSQTV